MEQNTNPLTTRKANKGFRIWLGDTYVGYLNIGEKNVPAETIASLQNPDVMTAVLAKAELKPYEADKPRDMTSVNQIIAGVNLDAEVTAEINAALHE